MKHKLLASTLAAGALAAGSLLQASPAEAFSWDDNRATIQAGDAAGTFFDVFFFDGYINEALIQGLTSQARFTLTSNYDGGDTAAFNVDVLNTSDSSIFTNTRVSGLGFNTNPELKSVTINGAVFDNAVLDSRFPQPPITGGRVDVCFTAGNSCTGGGGDGVNLSQSTSFHTVLKFKDAQNAIHFDLTDFRVRYQSIDFVNGPRGESGVGVGTVPTPALLPGLLSIGFAALRNKKKQEETTEAENSKEPSLV